MIVKKNQRIIALAIALLMVLQILPASFLIATAADEAVTHTFDATTLTATADKEAVEDGTAFAEGCFTSFGKLTKRTKNDAVYCVELEKKNAGGLTFEVKNTATLTVWISSTGGSNISTFNLLDSNGIAVADKDGITTPEVTGTTYIEVTYTDLPAGIYQIACPSSERNTRLQKAVVSEASQEAGGEDTDKPVTATYTFDSTSLTAAADKEAVESGTAFANGYFTSFGKLTKRVKSEAVYCVELEKKNAGGLSFDVKGTATVTMWISSTGGSNTSTFNLLDANGAVVADKDGIATPEVTGTTYIEVTYADLPAGTYQIACPSSERNTRLQRVVVVETAGSSTEETITPTETPADPTPATSWDFTSDDYTGQSPYNGLEITGGGKHGATYGMKITGGTISVPVSGACEILVSVGYNWDITFPDGKQYKDNTNSGDIVVSYIHTGEAGMVDIVTGSEFTSYIKNIELKEYIPEVKPNYESGKIYVWDFAGEQLEGEQYVNMLNADIINSWFPGVEPGTTGKNLTSFTTPDGLLSFNDGGYTGTHRLRVNVEGITCYETGKYLKGADGITYNGYIYSNKSGDTGVYITIKATAGDILTFILCSNGTEYTAVLESPSGAKQTVTRAPKDSKDAAAATFYATEDGTYKLYYTQEKMVVGRIYLEHNSDVTVTGKVTAPEALTGYKLLFTNTASGATTEAAVENGAYSVDLIDNYSYTVSLVDANGYIVYDGKELTIAKGASAPTHDVTIIAVEIVTITGKITGLSEAALAKLQLKLLADAIYVPEITISGDSYTFKAEKGQEYTLVAEGVNDFALTGEAKVTYNADGTADIAFAAKPTYKVTISPDGCTLADLAGATFTFTNLNEEGYVYTFTGTENIALRDGTYKVKVTGAGKYVQELTSNLVVSGAAVTKSIPFAIPTSWDFSSEDFEGVSPYNTLTFTNGNKNKTYLLANAGTISVPVQGRCKIVVSACYAYSFYFTADTEASVGVETKSTSQIDTFTYLYTGEAGTVDITVLGQSYIVKIEILEAVEYKETVTVGASGCDYTTIGDALEAVRAMDRTAEERVTILIQPGNYEEMLVVDVPNVTLKNASENPSIALKDQGVGIDANAVRITWYYGHGYNYYSMGSDYKFDADILAVNKENGYISTVNPGSGTATYWNASVVIAADGFRAEGIIFENSFNQYISEAAARDILEKKADAKEGTTPRTEMIAGSVLVQDKKYVERAAALAITDGTKEAYFENCKFVGRQDTLYGGHDATAAFYDCAIYGSTDYIFGGMTAVFAKCDLVFNTSEDKNDVGYITAPQTKDGHGLLMFNCTVTSTTPGVDTASQYTSKPGYFGRPWQANSGEAVFYKTAIEATCNNFYSIDPSLIRADGWLSTLSGESALCGEFGTYEYAKDVDHSGKRVSWAAVFTEEKLASGEPISIETWLGDWDAFAGKDLTVVIPTEKVDNSGKEEPGEGTDPEGTTPEGEQQAHTLDATRDLEAMEKGAKNDGDTLLVNGYFTIHFSAKNKIDGSNKEFSDGYTATQRLNFGGKTTKELYNTVEFTTTGAVTVKIWWVSGGADRTFAIYDASGNIVCQTEAPTDSNLLFISTLTLDAAGTYYLGVPTGSNYLFRLDVSPKVEEEPGEGTDPSEPEASEPKPTEPEVTEPKPTEPEVTEPKPTTPEDDDTVYVDKTFVLDVTKDIQPFISGSKAAGETISLHDFFTIICGAKTKVDSSSKVFSDGYSAGFRLNFQDSTDEAMNCTVKFTTEGAATIKIWWVSGGDGRSFAIYDENGQIVTRTTDESVKNSLYISTLELSAAGTYYLGVPEGSNNLFRMDVTTKVPAESGEGEQPGDTTDPTEGEDEDDETVLDISSDLDPFEVGSKADGETMVIGDFFTLHLSAKSKVESKVKTFPDGYIGTQRFSLGGKTEVENGMLNSVEFNAEGATTVKIWWVGGGEGRYIAIYDANGHIVASTELCEEKDDLHISELTLTAGGKYYIGMPEGNNYLFRINVDAAEVTEPDATEPVAPPATGDSSALSLVVALLAISFTALAILPRKKGF